MTLILTVLYTYLFILFCWMLYLATMNLAAHRKDMGWVAKIHAYILIAFALVMDFILTVVVGTVVFASLPKEWTLTDRLKRHKLEGGWRAKLASWICQHLLDQFDPDGDHC